MIDKIILVSLLFIVPILFMALWFWNLEKLDDGIEKFYGNKDSIKK